MQASRRRFLQLMAAAPVMVSGRAGARTGVPPPEIHTETRNTRFGALGRRWPRELPETPPARLSGMQARQLPPSLHFGRSLGDVVASYQPGQRFGPVSSPLSALASLLHFTNGVTGQHRAYTLRAAPSAGALYAGELYVVVARVDGLSPGLYYYDVVHHHLLELRLGALHDEVQAALERPSEIENAAFAIVLTNVFGRYSWRYANRSYRYALIDSGHTGENLRLAASSSGLADVSPLRFCDDALNSLLGVDGRREAACALHAIGTPAGSPAGLHAGTATAAQRLVEKQRLEEIPTGGRVTERYHEATKLVPGHSLDSSSASSAPDSSDASASGPPRPLDSISSSAQSMELPAPSSPPMTVEAAIEVRRSARAFTTLPVQQDDLSFLLQMAAGNDALRRTHGVRLFAVVHRVADLDRGVYEYLPTAHRLLLVRAGDMVRPMLRAVGQPLVGTAGVAFVMAARLSQGSGSPLGDRRYRDLLLESGAMAERIYLAAESAGLAARNLAAFVDDHFNEKLELAALGLSALHLTVIGNGN